MPHVRPIFLVLLALSCRAATIAETVPDSDAPTLHTVAEAASLTLDLRDGRAVTGRLFAYDRKGFHFGRDADAAQQFAWDDLPPMSIVMLLGPVIDAESAEENFRLGRILTGIKGGDELAGRIFQNAIRIDPRYEQVIETYRESGRIALPPPDAPAADALPDTAPTQPRDPRAAKASQYTWQSLTPEQLDIFVEAEKTYVNAIFEHMGVQMRLIETDHYLFYTDADPRQVARMTVLLENMYRRLAQRLDIPPHINIWRGKALVIVCADEALYHRIEREVFGNPNSANTAGICHSFPTGEVRICFRTLDDPWNLSHLLVHETTHGFLHRYRSPHRIPSWLNEGLAEYMGTRLVVQSQFNKLRREEGRRELLQRNGSFQGALEAQNIPHWFYGISLLLVEMLIDKDRQGVYLMIGDIKDGMTWQQALKKRYNMTPQNMADELQNYMRLRTPITL